MRVEPTLWDVEDMTGPLAVRDTTVGPVGTRDVEEFCRRYHYTGIGNNVPWRYGLWHGPTLLGVVCYNLPTRSVCASVLGEDHLHRVWHMSRLAISDAAQRNSESRLIGGSLRAIQAEHPHVWAVLTYADTNIGHIGYVYQATNAIYTGTGGRSAYYLDPHGRRRGTHHGGHYVTQAQAMDRGWEVKYGGAKHRYVYILGNKSERRRRRALLRFPELPYPKAGPLDEEGAA